MFIETTVICMLICTSNSVLSIGNNNNQKFLRAICNIIEKQILFAIYGQREIESSFVKFSCNSK